MSENKVQNSLNITTEKLVLKIDWFNSQLCETDRTYPLFDKVLIKNTCFPNL